MSYLDATKDLYKEAALTPDVGLCCTTTPIWQFPGLSIPTIMQEMNYGCGSTVHPRDLVNNPKILYVGVGGGMELLQFSYFSRQKEGVIGIDVVEEMLDASRKNFVLAEEQNDWFQSDFVTLKKGDALQLPVEDESIDVAAQNCCEQPMNQTLRDDERLRALCLSGAIPLKDYIKMLTDVGFGTIEIRAKRPYRILDKKHYPTEETIFIESVEVCAIKDPMPEDGPCVFTGKAAIYFGDEDFFDDKKGHVLLQNQPLAVCDKTAGALAKINQNDLYISESTFHYDGGGCC